MVSLRNFKLTLREMLRTIKINPRCVYKGVNASNAMPDGTLLTTDSSPRVGSANSSAIESLLRSLHFVKHCRNGCHQSHS